MALTSPVMAFAVLLGVDMYLRVSELVGAKCGDLLAPTTEGVQHWALMLFPRSLGRSSKTGAYDETLAIDSSRTRWMVPALKALHSKNPKEPLCGGNYADLIKLFTETCRSLGLHVLPSEMRHSGASLDRAFALRSSTETQRRGRWACAASTRRYEKRGILNESWSMLNGRQQSFCQNCASRIDRLVLYGEAPLPM